MLADGFRVGDQLYYIGAGLDFGEGNGDRLEYGMRGKVCGPPQHPSVPCGVSMRFPGNEGTSSHFMCFLSRSPPCPSLMKGFTIGEQIYWTGDSAEDIVHGQAMTVLGPGISHDDNIVGLSVDIGSKRKRVGFDLVRRTVPTSTSLPTGTGTGTGTGAGTGAHALGKQLVYTGKGFEYIIKDKTCEVLPGELGRVVGHPRDGHALAIHFPSIPTAYCVHVNIEDLAAPSHQTCN